MDWIRGHKTGEKVNVKVGRAGQKNGLERKKRKILFFKERQRENKIHDSRRETK